MRHITIECRQIGEQSPAYIIAEMSANHNQDFDQAVRIIHAAKEAGADAIKLQTYTPDTMTIDCRSDVFMIGKGTIWEGKNLYELYGEAYTPWEWQPKLKRVADGLGLHTISTPFDSTAVNFLEDMGLCAYKIASFELVDLPLIRRVAGTGKPVIMSTGMATLSEIDEAVTAAREAGAKQISLLKCTSAYPAAPSAMNLRTIPHLAEAFDVVVGLSDHSLEPAVPIAAVCLGARIVEKHLTLSRDIPGPDSAFSVEPAELGAMVQSIRAAEAALGSVQYAVTEGEFATRVFRRSLFAVESIEQGELFTERNVRVIRPGHGLHPRHLGEVIGRRAARDISRGTPLAWELVG